MGSAGNLIGSPPTPAHTTANSTSLLHPTWYGFVSDTKEALQLFEAVLSGQLHRVIRRPHDRERSALIRSGNVFVYEESASGIKRWTDGLPWSPSRILGNFLIYRELEKPFAPGEKKRASKKPKRPVGSSDYSHSESESMLSSPTSPSTPSSPGFRGGSGDDRDAERSLIGSLMDSYAFRDGGLVKKTMSVKVDETHHLHLVSYYNPEDVKQNMLPRVHLSELSRINPRPQLVHGQNFRAPLDDSEEALQLHVAQQQHAQQQKLEQQHHAHPRAPNGYGLPGMGPAYLGQGWPSYVGSQSYATSGYTQDHTGHTLHSHLPQQQQQQEQYSFNLPPPISYSSSSSSGGDRYVMSYQSSPPNHSAGGGGYYTTSPSSPPPVKQEYHTPSIKQEYTSSPPPPHSQSSGHHHSHNHHGYSSSYQDTRLYSPEQPYASAQWHHGS